jgi:hypothetical protein
MQRVVGISAQVYQVFIIVLKLIYLILFKVEVT